ncbi:hypothetical protein ACFYSC_35015 [Streptosporangium sp. NPDC004379]|uniref:hypothetical protein n=1 Tax=Streptosporangium sp. NPDC004379 TaxID=3366189 RepID=UPI0036B3F5FB
MRKLDGSNLARVALLTGLSAEQINAVGGVREDALTDPYAAAERLEAPPES